MNYRFIPSCTQLLGQAAKMLVALFVFASVVGAQVSTAGRMTGTIMDAAGAVVPNVSVTAKNDQTQQTIVVTTNAEGSWTMPSVSTGTYT
ncbi:MAG TPA: carboxypeptidase-like regulatory domain-containing protein, partial [Blastocatellia bacterium]|nr:carboxypeptidase-like regulatory domain-containing protein [Blastocatellia bacterium]